MLLQHAHVMIDPSKTPVVEQGVIEPAGGKYPDDSIGKVSLYYYGDQIVDAALVPISGRSSSEDYRGNRWLGNC